MELPTGRVRSVRGASALKAKLLEGAADQLERMILSSALADLDDEHMAECLNLLMGSFSKATAEGIAAWDRTVGIEPAGAAPLSAVVRAKPGAEREVTWEKASWTTEDPRVKLLGMHGSCTLSPEMRFASRATLDMQVQQGALSKRCVLTLLMGVERPTPLEFIEGR